jgi:signal transduction histidine kinase
MRHSENLAPGVPMLIATGDYAGVVSSRVSAERLALSTAWLTRLSELLNVGLNDVFPTDQLLDHIPTLIGEIAVYLRAPTDEEIAANAAVIAKARELGVLRYQQRASVHQVLREYEVLAEILERFVVDETSRLGLQPSSAECFELQHRLNRSTRTLMRTTVETFISEYTSTIQTQNERMQTFNRLASHELRSQVGTLVFAAALLKSDGVQTDRQRVAKVATTIQTNTERLSWLIENLQRLARLGEGMDVPSQQRVDLSTIAREVARQLEEMAGSRGVSLRIDDELPTVTVDPARLELVLLNLVSNAIKYSDPSKTDSFVSIERGASDTERESVISVRDNGLGIPDADRPAVFDRFYRAHAHLDNTLGVTGTGLGLAIVAECVDALGGSIRFESTPGHGTTFFVTLPRDIATGSEPTTRPM